MALLKHQYDGPFRQGVWDGESKQYNKLDVVRMNQIGVIFIRGVFVEDLLGINHLKLEQNCFFCNIIIKKITVKSNALMKKK